MSFLGGAGGCQLSSQESTQEADSPFQQTKEPHFRLGEGSQKPEAKLRRLILLRTKWQTLSPPSGGPPRSTLCDGRSTEASPGHQPDSLQQ